VRAALCDVGAADRSVCGDPRRAFPARGACRRLADRPGSDADLLGWRQGDHGTRADYDSADRLVQSSNALGGTTKYQYDARRFLTDVTDPAGFVRHSAFDAAGRRIKQTDPLGGATHTSFDAVGNPKSVTDANGATTTSVYDALNRAVQTTDALGNSTRRQYDPRGLLIQLVDPTGASQKYEYDAAGRQTKANDPLGATTPTLRPSATPWTRSRRSVEQPPSKVPTDTLPYDLCVFGRGPNSPDGPGVDPPGLEKDFKIPRYGSGPVDVGPEELPAPKGKSAWRDPNQAPLSGPYYKLHGGTQLPPGLKVVADGKDVGGAEHLPGHHTIFPSLWMSTLILSSSG